MLRSGGPCGIEDGLGGAVVDVPRVPDAAVVGWKRSVEEKGKKE